MEPTNDAYADSYQNYKNFDAEIALHATNFVIPIIVLGWDMYSPTADVDIPDWCVVRGSATYPVQAVDANPDYFIIYNYSGGLFNNGDLIGVVYLLPSSDLDVEGLTMAGFWLIRFKQQITIQMEPQTPS